MNPIWTGIPVSRQRSTTRAVSARSRAIGFSLQIAFPARSAASIRVAWVLVGVTMMTASTSGSLIAARASLVERSARPVSRPRSASPGSRSATTTSRAAAIPASVWRCVRPIRPTPRNATPMLLGFRTANALIRSPRSLSTCESAGRGRGRFDAADLVGDALRDALRRKPVAIEKERVRRRFAPRVRDADPDQPARLVLGQDLGDEAAETAEDRVLLGADHEANTASGVDQGGAVDRLQARDMQDAGGDPA